MMADGISCIVTSYNDAEYLPECIESIAACSLANYEIIVVDDGSTAATSLEVLERLRNEGVHLIRKPNGGVGSARNMGIAKAKFSTVVAIDADDKITPTYLKEAVAVLETQPKVGVVYADVQRFGLSDEVLKPGAFDHQRLLSGNYIAVSAVYRKQHWEEVGGYDETLPNYEDWDFWIRLSAKGTAFHYHPGVGLLYRKRSNSKVVKCANPAHREKVIAQIITKNKTAYVDHFPAIIARLHHTIANQEAAYTERLSQLNNADQEALVKEIEQLRIEKRDMQHYYEGSVFWKMKTMFNRFFKRTKS
jgi:glycosyltransferase involved in cell wall biosynthesis